MKRLIIVLLILLCPVVCFAQNGLINERQIAPVTVNVAAGEPLTAGKVVSLINESGTIKAYNNTLTVNTSPNGAESVFSSEASYGATAVALDGTRFLTTYTDGYNACYARVGTVSGSSITWGTKSSRIDTVAVLYGVTCKVDTDKVLFAYRDATNAKGNMVILSVSGTNVSIGTVAYFASISSLNPGSFIDLCLLEPNKAALIYQKSSDGYGKAKIVTISGTTPTPYPDATSDGVEFNASSTSFISAGALNSTKVVVLYRDGTTYGICQTITISGSTITPNTKYTVVEAPTAYTKLAILSESQAALSYHYSGYHRLNVANIDGTVISFGSHGAGYSDAAISPSLCSVTPNKFLAFFFQGTYLGTYSCSKLCTATSNGVVYGSSYTYNTAESSSKVSSCSLGIGKAVVSFTDAGNSSYGTSVVNTWGTPTYYSVRGVSQGSYSAGQTASVLLKGIDANQTSLITGSEYYLQSDFTIGTTPVGLLNTISTATSHTREVLIGRAKSATELRLDINYK